MHIKIVLHFKLRSSYSLITSLHQALMPILQLGTNSRHRTIGHYTHSIFMERRSRRTTRLPDIIFLNEIFMQEVQFPEHLSFLLDTSARYKVLWGGRGAGKTENIAIALIILSCQQRLRIACFREFQKSIDESVYEILKAKIYSMGLEDEFKILDKTIISKRTGSQFIFLGLRYNINSIKSLAFIDIAWVEEANVVSKMSWDKLNPT